MKVLRLNFASQLLAALASRPALEAVLMTIGCWREYFAALQASTPPNVEAERFDTAANRLISFQQAKAN
jgi:hypothetical protein